MRTHLSKLLAIVLLSLGAFTATAWATEYQWTLSGGGIDGSGMLTTGAADGGGFDVLSFTGIVDGSPVTLFGGQPGPVGAFSPGREIYYNNILYPALDAGSSDCAGGSSLVDGCGIGFTLDGRYGNIFANYSGRGTGAYEFAFVLNGNSYNDLDETFTIAPNSVTPPPPLPTPEPATVLLLATGLAALGVMKLKA